MSNLYFSKCLYRIIACILRNNFVGAFKSRDIDTAHQGELKEEIGKSTKVEKRGNKAQWTQAVERWHKITKNNNISDENDKITDYTC